MRSLRSPRGVMVAGLVVGLLAALRLLWAFGWDPTVFTAFGDDAIEITAYAEDLLGREVLTRPGQGHDGKFFFVQANDPWLLAPEENGAILDRPEYRSRRMFYPLLAGGLGLLGAHAIVWTLPIVNVLLLGVGTWATARIAQRHGGPAWLGLAFAFNIGLLSDLFIDSAGIAAFAFAALGVLWLEEERVPLSSAAFVAAVLSREVMALFVGFVALGWLVRRRKVPWLATLPAALALLIWEWYVRVVVDLPDVPAQDSALTFVPFRGFWTALTSGFGQPIDYVMIFVFLILIVMIPYRAITSVTFLTWGAVGVAILGPFLTFPIWQKSFDISRALAPLLTVFVLEMFIDRRAGDEVVEQVEPLAT